MQNNSLFTAVLIVLLASPVQTLGDTGTKWLTNGKPIQVRIIQPATDHNHDTAVEQRPELKLAAQRDEQGKPQASTTGFQIPLRRGLSNTYPGLMAIAAYVDHDDLNPDSLLDWNCGERTYAMILNNIGDET